MHYFVKRWSHMMTPVQRSLRHRAKSTRPKVWVFEPQHHHHNAPDQMIRTCARATIRSRTSPTPLLCLSTQWLARRQFSSTAWRKEDPRIESMGKEITDEFAVIREEYGAFSIGLCVHVLTLFSYTSSYDTPNTIHSLTPAETHHRPCSWAPWLQRTTSRRTVPPRSQILAWYNRGSVSEGDRDYCRHGPTKWQH